MKKIETKTLPSEVASRIRLMIRNGQLGVGEHIVEGHLCDELGVSRTPLREALQVLSAEGLVILVPNRGAYVSKPSMEEVGQMFEVMGMLEGMCAKAATEKMTARKLDRLKRAHELIEAKAALNDYEGYLHANHAYHTMIEKMTENQVLIDIVQSLRHKILIYRQQQLRRPNRIKESLAEHRELQKKFEECDAKGAEVLMCQHLERQHEALLEVYEDQSAQKGSPRTKNRA